MGAQLIHTDTVAAGGNTIVSSACGHSIPASLQGSVQGPSPGGTPSRWQVVEGSEYSNPAEEEGAGLARP